MKLKTGFVLHQMGDEYVVVAVEERTKEFAGLINLNRSGAFLWKQMNSDFTRESLTSALLEQYDVDETTARRAVDSFVDKLLSVKVIEE